MLFKGLHDQSHINKINSSLSLEGTSSLKNQVDFILYPARMINRPSLKYYNKDEYSWNSKSVYILEEHLVLSNPN